MRVYVTPHFQALLPKVHAYDAAGNQTQSNENGQVQSYRYDAAGRLVEITNGIGVHTYAYGPNNRRLQMVEAGALGGTTLYAWDGESVIAEYNGAGGGMVWTMSHVYLGGAYWRQTLLLMARNTITLTG